MRFPFTDAELRERSAEDRYVELVETLPLIVYSVSPIPPFEPLYISSGIEALGFTRDEWLRNPDNWVEHLHPDDRERILEATTAALASGQSVSYEYRLLTRDGDVRWFHDRGSFVWDNTGSAIEWRGVMIDITARREAEDALRRSEAHRRAVFEHSAVGITVVDENGLFIDANQKFLDFLGYSLAELRKLHAYEVSPPEDAYLTRNAVRELREGRRSVVDVEKRYIRKSGELRLGMLTLSLVETDARRAIVGMVQDITERRRTEEALRRSQEQLLQAQRLDMIGRLAGGIAHDFNNLLTVISSHVEFAYAEAPENTSVRSDLVAIQQAAERAANLTKQLLAFGRRQILQPVQLNVNELAMSVVGLLRRVLPENVVLTTALTDKLPLVNADRTQLEQVLISLVVNARDAMPGGGSLILRSGDLHTQGLVDAVGEEVADGHYVRISVEDTGHGMDESVRRRAFEPFFTTKSFGEGNGLGLSTVLGVIKQSGGFVLLDSDAERGTAVHIHLPAGDAGDAQSALSQLPLLAPALKTHGVVVVAEDEAEVRDVIRRMLQRQGYEVHESTNGVEAEALMELLHGRVDLVISDIVMPAMGGVELARRLRSSYPQVPILLISGYSGEKLEAMELIPGRCAFLAKPFSLGTLVQQAAQLIEASRMMR